MGIIGTFFRDKIYDKETIAFEDMFNKDLEKVTTSPDEKTDSISFYLKSCIGISLEGINTEDIEYYSKIKDNKVLILLKVHDMKNVEKSSRKELVYAIDDCIYDYRKLKGYEKFIGVQGNWNLLMVKTPNYSNLNGDYATKDYLYSFYRDDEEIEDLEGFETDTIITKN